MSGDAKALTALLGEERELLQQLATLLEREFAQARAGEDPTALLTEKQALIAALDTATAARCDWLDARRLPTHGEGLREAVARLDARRELAGLLEAFEAEAVACRDRNRQLAQFNLRRQQALHRALQLFTQPAQNEAGRYGARGQNLDQAVGRLLGSA